MSCHVVCCSSMSCYVMLCYGMVCNAMYACRYAYVMCVCVFM